MRISSTRRLEGKVAIITGAAKGIGASIAREFANEGAKVVINYNSSGQQAEALAEEINLKGGEAIAVRSNVAELSEVINLFEITQRTFGFVNIIINNAGVYRRLSFDSIVYHDFEEIFKINVLSVIFCTQQAIRFFPQNGGSIVNIGSVSATTTPLNSALYAAAKAAVCTLTRASAIELGARQIRVNAINPGLTRTESASSKGYLTDERIRSISALTPLGRIGCPSDIAKVALFLASEESDWITGETIFASGGRR